MPAIVSHSITFNRKICTVHLTGEMDVSNVDEINAWICDAIDAKHVKTVQIDLSQLGFIDSTGIRCPVRAHTYALRKHTKLTIINADPFVAKLFHITGEAELFGLN